VVVGIGVYVKEYTGTIVARLDGPENVNRLCAVAAEDPARYPLLSGVDDLDDTYFNARQSVRLAQELKLLAGDGSDLELREAAEAILLLADLLPAAPKRPHHRLLIFDGD
jgi:hypothetical protein